MPLPPVHNAARRPGSPLRRTACYLLFWFSVSLSTATAQDRVTFSPDVLDYPLAYTQFFDSIFAFRQVHKYLGECRENQVFLFNGYNEFRIDNPENWKRLRRQSRPVEVNVIYSAYPENFRRWEPEFCTLLARRLKALFLLDPKLNNPDVHWTLMEQTECSDIDEARSLLHGILITYEPKETPVVFEKPLDLSTEYFDISAQTGLSEEEVQEIRLNLSRFGQDNDSVVIRVFERHPEWENLLVVVDWTSSMYPYGSQVVLWQALHMARSGIRHLVFFNDGNRTLDVKKIGKTGGIYFVEPENIETIIATMRWVQSRGDGGDIPENDIEAILKGLDAYPDVDEVVLIADNNSDMRDFALLDKINKPVKVILCGDYMGINPQYLTLALKTGGSLHTIDQDIENLFSLFRDGKVEIYGYEYGLDENRDVKLNPKNLPEELSHLEE